MQEKNKAKFSILNGKFKHCEICGTKFYEFPGQNKKFCSISCMSSSGSIIKLHLGSGSVKIPGYLNIDITSYPEVDYVADVRNLPFEDKSVDFIYAAAILEHISRSEWKSVLLHWYNKLCTGGQLRVSVPDFEAICEWYIEHKKLDGLYGLVVGGQRDKYDYHGMIFDFNTLSDGLKEVGFSDIKRYDWKKTELYDLGIDDFSQAYLPYMNKKTGKLMMLNVIATKS